MDGGDWISLAGVVVAGGSAIWTVVWAIRAKRSEDSAKEQAGLAIKAAIDAASAAERSAGAAERSASALEAQAQIAIEQADAAEGVPWRLAHHRGDTYLLHNESDTPKFHVEITGPRIRRPVSAERVDGRSSVKFMAIPAGSLGDEVVVVWQRREDKSDTRRTWSGVKPPKP